MATFRVGIGSFNIKTDGSVGIGTEGTGHGNLKVEGTIKSTSADVLGVSTFTRYSGFSADEVKVGNRDLTLSGEYSTTGDVVVEDGASLTVGLGSTACIGTVESISVKNHFSVPSGDTDQRNESAGYDEGTVRYNSDLGTMEFFNGNEWKQFRYQSDAEKSPSNRGRAIFAGADQGGTNMIEFVNISTLGNAQTFGDTADTHTGHDRCGSASNSIRGLIAGGRIRTPSLADTNTIGYITICSSGNSIDFGDLTRVQRMMMGVSSSTRAVFAGGYTPFSNIIDYVEIGTLGNALDFGDLPFANQSGGPFSNGVTGVFGGGYSPARRDEIVKITIASKGDGTEFGTLQQKRAFPGGCSNSTRGIVAGGESPTQINLIDYITINHGGNATVFGDLTLARNGQAAASSQTRALIGGGGNPGNVRIIDYVQFSTTSDALDFGDLGFTGGRFCIALSDCHGGLGGY